MLGLGSRRRPAYKVATLALFARAYRYNRPGSVQADPFLTWRDAIAPLATNTQCSAECHKIVTRAGATCVALGIVEHIQHKRYQGEHAITQERFDAIVDWLIDCVGEQ